ncbi:MAG: hypothetical protein JNK82_41640 [Myxococcaceae bacterium]|nr:hypothetical protein [Myxococcaceae bacterium]
MDDQARREAEEKLKHQLEQICIELETAAAASRRAANEVDEPKKAWTDVQQLLTRYEAASHLMAEFRRSVDSLVKDSKAPEDAARIAAISRVDEKK